MNTPPAFDIHPVGDSGLIVQLAPTSDLDARANDVLQVRAALQGAGLRGVGEITTAFTSVAVFYDPMQAAGEGASIFPEMEAQIRSIVAGALSRPGGPVAEERAVEIPVCYDAEFALDLDELARHTGLQPEEVIRRHASSDYRVSCVGFTPGFPFLSGLPAELAMPRRSTPRTVVPAGSVAIGGSQTGIYPMQSPGGWNVIGRTPLRLFDVTGETPSLLQAGDRVRIRRISREEYDAAHAMQRETAVQASANK